MLSSEACDLSVSSYEASGPTFTALSLWTQQCLVILSFGVTVSLSLVASLWSLKTGRLSKVTGLDWEVYLFLLCCVGVALLVQAMWAVARLKPGDRFDSTAFAVASFYIHGSDHLRFLRHFERCHLWGSLSAVRAPDDPNPRGGELVVFILVPCLFPVVGKLYSLQNMFWRSPGDVTRVHVYSLCFSM